MQNIAITMLITTVDGTDVDAIVTIVSIKDASIVLTIQPTVA
jgi:hypothetical protein